MIRERRIALRLAISAGLCFGLAACIGGPPGPYSGRMPPEAAERMQAALADRAKLKAFDFNADHNISKEELETGLEGAFASLDTNRDGVLRAAEITKANERLTIEDSAMPPLRDWNQSGAVEFDEFAAWNRGRFRKTDADNDGTVTQAELTAPPKMPRRPPGGMPPGGMPPVGGGMPGGRLSQSVAIPGAGGT